MINTKEALNRAAALAAAGKFAELTTMLADMTIDAKNLADRISWEKQRLAMIERVQARDKARAVQKYTEAAKAERALRETIAGITALFPKEKTAEHVTVNGKKKK